MAREAKTSPLGILLLWATPGWLLGLAVFLDHLFLDAERELATFSWGYTAAELNALFLAHAVVVGLGTWAVLGVVAWFALGRTSRQRDGALHAALAVGSLAFWVVFAPSLDGPFSYGPTTSWALRVLSPIVAILSGGATYLMSTRNRWVPALGARILPLGALVVLGSSAVSTLFFVIARATVTTPTPISPEDPWRFPRADPPLERDGGRGRVIMLAIDGLDWDMLDAPELAGHLPNFDRVRAEGTSGVLRTLRPGASPRIWTSVGTGVDPGDHGVLWFDVQRWPAIGIRRAHYTGGMRFTKPIMDVIFDGSRSPVTGAERRVKALWNLCSEAEIKVAISGWWGTWPAEPIFGYMVSDHAYFDRVEDLGVQNSSSFGQTFPPALFDEIAQFQKRVKDATPDDIAGFVNLTENDRAHFQELLEIRSVEERNQPLRTITSALLKDRFYGNSALYIDETYAPDILISYFSTIDWFGHAVLELSRPDAAEQGNAREDIERYGGSMRAALLSMDAWLGRFIERLDDDATLIVLSDHGFQMERFRGEDVFHHTEGPPGVLMAMGGRIRTGARLDDCHVFDILPTLNHLLGLQVAEDLDGEILADLFEPEFLEAHPPRYVPTYEAGPGRRIAPTSTSEEDEDMMELLRALGYVR